MLPLIAPPSRTVLHRTTPRDVSPRRASLTSSLHDICLQRTSLATVGLHQKGGRFKFVGGGAQAEGLALLPSLISALAPLHVEEESEDEDGEPYISAGYCSRR